MKKVLCSVMVMMMLAVAFTGCSVFTTETNNGGEEATGSYEPVKISEDYSFADPAELDFDKRYVLTCDTSSQMIASASDYGMVASFNVYYEKEGVPVAEYDFFVVDSADHAQALISLYEQQGSVLTQLEGHPTILTSSVDGDTLEGNLVAFQSYGMISEAKLSAYVTFMAESMGGKVQ